MKYGKLSDTRGGATFRHAIIFACLTNGQLHYRELPSEDCDEVLL